MFQLLDYSNYLAHKPENIHFCASIIENFYFKMINFEIIYITLEVKKCLLELDLPHRQLVFCT